MSMRQNHSAATPSRPNMSSSAAKTPSVPRPSASLILLNRSFEVLLVQRNPKGSSFAGAHVFPGGNFDSGQDSSLRITALRETFEEAGVLFTTRATSSRVSEDQLDTARKDVHMMRLNFNQFLHEAGLELDTQALMPFTSWVTPPQVPKYVSPHLPSHFQSTNTYSQTLPHSILPRLPPQSPLCRPQSPPNPGRRPRSHLRLLSRPFLRPPRPRARPSQTHAPAVLPPPRPRVRLQPLRSG